MLDPADPRSAFDQTRPADLDAVAERRDRAPKVRDYVARRTEIDYALYVRYRGKLAE
jgi:hypothetical protein